MALRIESGKDKKIGTSVRNQINKNMLFSIRTRKGINIILKLSSENILNFLFEQKCSEYIENSCFCRS